MQYMQYLSKAV